jgi:hypothetical protein
MAFAPAVPETVELLPAVAGLPPMVMPAGVSASFDEQATLMLPIAQADKMKARMFMRTAPCRRHSVLCSQPARHPKSSLACCF